jgi:hypothetical protein
MKPGLYDMVRTTDQTGVSGTGRIAQMAVFEDGSAVVRWLTGKDSTVCWAKYQDALDVHINCHPDTTKLIPTGQDVCEHGIVTTEEYCDPCAVAAEGVDKCPPTRLHKRQDTVEPEVSGEEEMVSLIFETPYKRLVYTIEHYLNSRGLPHEKVTGHGLYYDVTLRGIKYMFDPTPEDQKTEKPEGLLVIRDGTHTAVAPTRLGFVLLYADDAYEALDELLNL